MSNHHQQNPQHHFQNSNNTNANNNQYYNPSSSSNGQNPLTQSFGFSSGFGSFFNSAPPPPAPLTDSVKSFGVLIASQENPLANSGSSASDEASLADSDEPLTGLGEVSSVAQQFETGFRQRLHLEAEQAAEISSRFKQAADAIAAGFHKRLRAAARRHAEETEALRNKMDQVARERDSLTASVSALEAKVDSQIAHMNEINDLHQANLSSKDDIIAAHEKQMADLQNSCNDYRAKIEQMQTESNNNLSDAIADRYKEDILPHINAKFKENEIKLKEYISQINSVIEKNITTQNEKIDLLFDLITRESSAIKEMIANISQHSEKTLVDSVEKLQESHREETDRAIAAIGDRISEDIAAKFNEISKRWNGYQIEGGSRSDANGAIDRKNSHRFLYFLLFLLFLILACAFISTSSLWISFRQSTFGWRFGVFPE